MKETTKKWLKYIEADMFAAETLLAKGKQMGSAYIIVIFHCHQAIEKTLKAILTEQEKEVVKIHNLNRLLVLTQIQIDGKIKKMIADINPHYIAPRYPDFDFKPSFTYTYNKANTQKILKNTKEILICLNNFLK